jgi:type IV pilus assembly protein PilA
MLARIRKAQEEGEGGFTLIELLVVIIIIGILAAIAIPVFLNQRKKGWDAQAKSDARNLATLEETYFTDAGNYLIGGSAANTTTLAGILTDYKASSNVTGAVVTGYASAGISGSAATSAAAVDGFCVKVTSKSTNVYYYDSKNGGLLPAGTTCA